VLDRSPQDPTANVPDDISCRAASCPGGVSPRDRPAWPWDGTARGATGTDGPGTEVTPPMTGAWPDDRGADGSTRIDTVAIMTKMTAAAEKKNTGSVLPAGCTRTTAAHVRAAALIRSTASAIASPTAGTRGP
jgi:hypothetical protein